MKSRVLILSVALGLVAVGGSTPSDLETMRNRGFDHYRHGRYEVALGEWEGMEQEARFAGDESAAAAALCLQSLALQNAGKPDASLRLAELCFQEMPAGTLAFDRLLDALTAAEFEGEAEQLLGNRIQALREHGASSAQLGAALQRLAALHQQQGRANEAEVFYLDAVALAESAGDLSRLARLLDALSEVYLGAGETRKAADLCGRREQLHAETDGTSWRVAETYQECSVIYEVVGRLDEARVSRTATEALRRDGPPDLPQVETLDEIRARLRQGPKDSPRELPMPNANTDE